MVALCKAGLMNSKITALCKSSSPPLLDAVCQQSTCVPSRSALTMLCTLCKCSTIAATMRMETVESDGDISAAEPWTHRRLHR